MKSDEITELIQTLLTDDENPPTENWSPYDYGCEVAKNLNDRDVCELAVEAIRRLPGSLAVSFLEGVLELHRPTRLKDELFEAFPIAQGPTSAANLLDILREKCGASRLELGLRLAGGLERAKDPHAQDNYAYGLLWLLGNRQPAGSQAAKELKQQGSEYDLIQTALARISIGGLSEYARNTLEECMIVK